MNPSAIFKRFQRLQGGSEAVAEELPTPPEQPPDRGDRLRRYLFNDVRQGILPDEALAEMRHDPTSLRSILGYGEAAMAAGTLLSGGRGKGPVELRSAAIKLPDGQVFEGRFHSEAHNAANEAGVEVPDVFKEGYVTNRGKFITNEQARNGWGITDARELESDRQGTSDVGLKIFKTHQWLQGGEYDVRGKEPPFAEGGKWWWERADERAKQDDEQGHDAAIQQSEDADWEKTLQRRRETAYKTVGVNINGQEVEIPIWDEDMTPEQAEGFARDRLEMGLSPFASDMELEAAQKNNAKRQGYAMGTSSVNPGLKLFHAKQKRKK